ncbi:MAG: N-acetylmuramoyl-L-alanine amidase [candidate division Zixibacteria bacterium]|nr:N-acetylmuramoyl-L-alanine amidase [candidate division Zixibacteria bacterium]
MKTNSRKTSALISITILFGAYIFSSCGAPIVRQEGIPSSQYPHFGEPNLRVIYPKFGQSIPYVDSTFILGSISPEWNLQLNGEPVDVHPDGGWIAYVAISSGDFEFRFAMTKDAAKRNKTWPVIVSGPGSPDSFDSLTIKKDNRKPELAESFVLGEIVYLQFEGSPGCRAWAELPGLADSVPMTETPERFIDSYESGSQEASVFKNSLNNNLRPQTGVYQGMYIVDSSKSLDTVPVVFHLSRPSAADVLAYIRERSTLDLNFNLLKALRWPVNYSIVNSKSDTSEINISINPAAFPRTVEFTDTTQIMRVGPGKGYLGLFQPVGTRALTTGYQGSWYKLKLSESQIGYVDTGKVKLLPQGIHPPHSHLTRFVSNYDVESLEIRATLKERHPFSVIEPDSRTIVLELFGVTMDTDWFRHDFADPNLDGATWKQLEPGKFQLTLKFKTPYWGYETTWSGGEFVLRVIYAPQNTHSLRNKIIVIDPGHSRDPGAIGPTGLTEAEANLNISLKLCKILEARGASVVLTRTDSRHVPLYDRPKIAGEIGADLFVSIHNNALPDGINPFVNHGVSTYYYHTHSIALGKSIHREMIKISGQKDHGFYHGNLAVCRPTLYPAVLVECGFMILPEQEAWLKTDKYQSRVATAIANGIQNFLRNYGA